MVLHLLKSKKEMIAFLKPVAYARFFLYVLKPLGHDFIDSIKVLGS